jgi:hypothetical protein
VAGFSGAASRDAFVWTPVTGMVNLQDYLVGREGWRLDTTLAISRDATAITGWGNRPDGRVQSRVVEHPPPFGATG